MQEEKKSTKGKKETTPIFLFSLKIEIKELGMTIAELKQHVFILNATDYNSQINLYT